MAYSCTFKAVFFTSIIGKCFFYLLLYFLNTSKKKRKVGKRKEEGISSTNETILNRLSYIDVVIVLANSFPVIVNVNVIVKGNEAIIDVLIF